MASVTSSSSCSRTLDAEAGSRHHRGSCSRRGRTSCRTRTTTGSRARHPRRDLPVLLVCLAVGELGRAVSVDPVLDRLAGLRVPAADDRGQHLVRALEEVLVGRRRPRGPAGGQHDRIRVELRAERRRGGQGFPCERRGLEDDRPGDVIGQLVDPRHARRGVQTDMLDGQAIALDLIVKGRGLLGTGLGRLERVGSPGRACERATRAVRPRRSGRYRRRP